MNYSKVQNNSSIWDLHIHTCKCPKSSKEFKNMQVDEYVDNLIKIFKDYKNLELISFTDHNSISVEVYKEFEKRKTGINLLPGIEIDVVIPGVNDYKHIIFYFNLKNLNFEKFSTDLNTKLSDKTPINIHDILDYLISENIEFIMSPHALKQDKRGIDYNWNDSATSKQLANKYMDQFFCFWETAGHSSIAHAVEFLKDFELENNISVISFSDSSDYKSLKSYLDNPPQYFISLPNFKGVQLVGTDCQRIIKEKKEINMNNLGNFIGSITINGKEIILSDRLNAIVGGRGSGKSLLLDNIALNLKSAIKNDGTIGEKRIKFLETTDIKLINYDKTKIEIDSKIIDFFNQAYVSKIFDSDEKNKLVESYFKDEFNSLELLSSDTEIANLKVKFSDLLHAIQPTSTDSNISNLIELYKNIEYKTLQINIKSKDAKIKDKINYDVKTSVNSIIKCKNIVPKSLQTNKKIIKSIESFLNIVINEVNVYNDHISKNNLEPIIKNSCLKLNEEKSEDLKKKNEVEQKFLECLKNEFLPFVKRANIVNALIALDNEFTEIIESSDIKESIEGNKFKFERKITLERPMNYFRRKCMKYFGSTNSNVDIITLINHFVYYADDKMLKSKSLETFCSDLKELEDYRATLESNILYGLSIDNMKNIREESPGTQTNILMEYIVSKDSEIPLLIDQPEDNIDNQTIYGKLTMWFRTLKLKRQVIVVTHDANIVINSDAENVIIATAKKNNEFEYLYGALEYGDNLKKISIILDGGIDAVERRLKKYGK